MAGFELSTFIPQELNFPYQLSQWEDRFSDRYNIPRSAGHPRVPVQFNAEQEPVIGYGTLPWLSFVPGDSVNRLQNLEGDFSTLFDLVDESFQNLQNDTYNDPVKEVRQQQSSVENVEFSDESETVHPEHPSPENRIKNLLGNRIAHFFRGMIIPDQVFSDDVSDSGGSITQRSGQNEIVISKPSNNPSGRLARDIVTYEVNNCDEFFENAWTQSLILNRLIHSDIKPISIEYTVEFPHEPRLHDEKIAISVGI